MGRRRRVAKENHLNFSGKLSLIRIGFVVILVGLMFVIYYIKAINGDDYEKRAIRQQVNKITDRTINANRGNILDRNRQSLAVSTTVYNVAIDVRQTYELTKSEESIQTIVKAFNEVLGIPIDEMLDYFKKDPSTGKLLHDTHWKLIAKAKGIERKQVDQLKEYGLKTVYFEEDTKRTYVNKNMAAQLIGFRRGDAIWGLEKQYDSYMIGTNGRLFMAYDSEGTPQKELIAPVKGNTLITTIDQGIQQFAEDAVVKWGTELQAQNATAMVMNPNTGEMYAMALYPSFNINAPDDITSISNQQLSTMLQMLPEEEQLKDMDKIWRNYNISDTYEPGSVFKPITLAAALEEKKVALDAKYFCGGKKVFTDDFEINCHQKSGHGYQTLEQALANSCNVALMNIMEELGKEDFYKHQRDFGFGEITGIDLPGEASAAPNVYTLSDLNIEINRATSAIGQGFNCTPIQAITAFAAIINGGYLYKPYVVSQIVDADGNIVKENYPVVQRKVISKETSDYLRINMEKVVSEGTGRKAKIEGYSIGGKTGTAEQGVRGSKQYVVSFAAYFPVDDPEYLVLVSIDRPFVEDDDNIPSPSPMLKELIEKIISYKTIPPSFAESADALQDRTGTSSNEMPDFIGNSLADATKVLNEIDVDYKITGGKGNIVGSQVPAPGTVISAQTVPMLFISLSDPDANLVTMPNLIGLSADDAKSLLEGLGLKATIVVNEAENADGLVYAQVPDPNVGVPKGTYVRVTATYIEE